MPFLALLDISQREVKETLSEIQIWCAKCLRDRLTSASRLCMVACHGFFRFPFLNSGFLVRGYAYAKVVLC